MKNIFLKFLRNWQKNGNYKWEVWCRGKLSVQFTKCFEGHVHQELYQCCEEPRTRRLHDFYRRLNLLRLVLQMAVLIAYSSYIAAYSWHLMAYSGYVVAYSGYIVAFSGYILAI